MDTSHKFLSVEGVTKTFLSEKAPKTVLNGVSFELPFHDSLAIVGPSGCGKTTLILIIAGLLEATEGSIFFQDTPVKTPNRKTALVLQEYGLFPWKTVAANILLGAKLQNIEVSEQRLETLKNELEIEGLDHLYPTQLSGGTTPEGGPGQGAPVKPAPAVARRALCGHRHGDPGKAPEPAPEGF